MKSAFVWGSSVLLSQMLHEGSHTVGSKVAQLHEASCPRSLRLGRPERTSHTHTLLSAEAVHTLPLPACQLMSLTLSV